MKLTKAIIVFCLVITFFSCSERKINKVNESSELGIIPKPVSLVLSQDVFSLEKEINVYFEEANDYSLVTEFLTQELEEYGISTNLIKVISTEKISDGIILKRLIKDTLNNEGYILDINENCINISGESSTGIFYACRTLLQILSTLQNNIGLYDIPGLYIIDQPAFKWRGMHLDVCRHFYSKEFIKKYIDLISLHKMNTFHWHLTEDQGWRIEITKYPKLTEIGSKRKETIIDKNFDPYIGDSIPYSGYYSQDDIREIVEHAKKRFVTVIPEIEMPGHSLAALAAYPNLSCTGGDFEVGTKWGVYEDVYCAGNDTVFQFLENILDEVIELFPSEHIHIGGDECPKTRWESCSKCQQRITDENLKNEHELQSYFIKRIESYLASKNKTIIGWDEILEGGLAPQAVVMSWRGMDGGIAAANEDHYVIMSPGTHCYFDHYQAKEGEPLAIGGYSPLEKVYSFNPVPPELETNKRKYILGAQGNVWTEYIPDSNHVEYMSVPRMSALAEVVWTYSKRDYSDFLLRLEKHFSRLDKLNVNYRRPKNSD